MKLSAQFDYQEVDHEKDNTLRLLLTVEAPAIDWVAQRPKIGVLPVIDTSGSMQGRKFEYAVQACRKLVEQLKPGDYAGLVTFAYKAKLVVPPRLVTPELKTELLRELGRLVPNGGTNFSEAVTMSLEALGNLDLPPSILQRAIFFTDGEPTTGVVDHGAIKGLLATNLKSFSMSFFGYGDATGGACDQEFLTELSDIGKGSYAYVQNPDDALAAFGRELGGLLSTYATDLRLIIEPRNGHSIERVVTSLGPDSKAASTDVTELALELGDILAEEQRHVVLECVVRQQDKALPRDFTAFNVTGTCRRVTQDGTKTGVEVVVPARIRFVRPADAQKVPTPEVDKIVALHQLALAQREAEARAAEGKYAEAQEVLNSFSTEAQNRGYVNVAGVASNLGKGMTSPLVYRSSQGYRKSMGQGLLRSSKVASYDGAARVDLSTAGGGGTSGTTAQAAYSAMFTSSTPDQPLFVAPEPLGGVPGKDGWWQAPEVPKAEGAAEAGVPEEEPTPSGD
jgi:Ca-activated chloride channel homolog